MWVIDASTAFNSVLVITSVIALLIGIKVSKTVRKIAQEKSTLIALKLKVKALDPITVIEGFFVSAQSESARFYLSKEKVLDGVTSASHGAARSRYLSKEKVLDEVVLAAQDPDSSRYLSKEKVLDGPHVLSNALDGSRYLSKEKVLDDLALAVWLIRSSRYLSKEKVLDEKTNNPMNSNRNPSLYSNNIPRFKKYFSHHQSVFKSYRNAFVHVLMTLDA